MERVAWEVLVLLTGVATVEGIELGDDVLVAAVNLLAGTAAVVVLGGEEDVEATDALEGGEEVVAGTDETGLLTALLAWNLVAQILSRVLLHSLLRLRL